MKHDILDLAAIRAQHTLILLGLLWHERLSRIELSRRVGLSRSAISSIIAALIEHGLVRETGQNAARSGAGRKASLLELRADAAHLVSVDLGARDLRVALLDLRCTILDVIDVQHDITTGPAATYARMRELIDTLLHRNHVPVVRVAMIGVGVPGPVDHHTGRVVDPPNMAGWDGENVAQALTATYPVRVLVDNDANLGALAEWRFGAHHGTRDLIYIKAATGIGAGIVHDGRLYRGVRGGAGEVGHISINEIGPRGRSGNAGSLESYAAAEVILTRAREHARQGDTALDPDCTLNDVLRLAQHDPVARALVRQVGGHLGVAITTVLNLFNPSVVVIGGRMALAGPPLLEAVNDVIRQRALAISRDSAHVTLGTLGRDTGVLGAGAMLLDALLTPAGLRHLQRVATGQPGVPPPETHSRGPPGDSAPPITLNPNISEQTFQGGST